MGVTTGKGVRMRDAKALHRVPSSGRVGNGMSCQFALKGSASRPHQLRLSQTHAEEEGLHGYAQLPNR